MRGDCDAGQIDLCVYPLVAAAAAVDVVLVNITLVNRRGANCAIGANILSADDITDDVGIGIRDHERFNRPGGRRIGLAGVAGGERRVKHSDAVRNCVADVNVRKAREEADAQPAPETSRRISVGPGRRRAE